MRSDILYVCVSHPDAPVCSEGAPTMPDAGVDEDYDAAEAAEVAAASEMVEAEAGSLS